MLLKKIPVITNGNNTDDIFESRNEFRYDIDYSISTETRENRFERTTIIVKQIKMIKDDQFDEGFQNSLMAKGNFHRHDGPSFKHGLFIEAEKKDLLFSQAKLSLNSDDFVVLQTVLNDIALIIQMNPEYADKFNDEDMEKIKSICLADNPRLSNFAFKVIYKIAKYSPSYISDLMEMDMISVCLTKLPLIYACKCIGIMGELNADAFNAMCEMNVPLMLYELCLQFETLPDILKGILFALITFTKKIDDFDEEMISNITNFIVNVMFPDKRSIYFFIETKKETPIDILLSSGKIADILHDFEPHKKLERYTTELFIIIASCKIEMSKYLIDSGINRYIDYYSDDEDKVEKIIHLSNELIDSSPENAFAFTSQDFMERVIKTTFAEGSIKARVEAAKFVFMFLKMCFKEECAADLFEIIDIKSVIEEMIDVDNTELLLLMLETLSFVWSFAITRAEGRPAFINTIIDTLVSEDVCSKIDGLIDYDDENISIKARELSTQVHAFV